MPHSGTGRKMIIRATSREINVIANLAIGLWKNHTVEELESEYKELLKKDGTAVFIDYEDDTPIGFAQVQLRQDYVEGTSSTPVGYLEGIYIKEKYRMNGIATNLLHSCENWAKEKGCKEFASDCEIENKESYEFHVKYGFNVANRIICFAKKIV